MQDAAHHALTAQCDAATQKLPHGWRWGRLDDVIKRIESGHSPRCLERPAESDEKAVIKTSAITRGRFLEDENKAVPAGTLLKEQHEIKAGDILLCRANSLDHVGATVHVTECRPGLYLSDKSLRLVPNTGIDDRWLVSLLAAPTYVQRWHDGATALCRRCATSRKPICKTSRSPLPHYTTRCGWADKPLNAGTQQTTCVCGYRRPWSHRPYCAGR